MIMVSSIKFLFFSYNMMSFIYSIDCKREKYLPKEFLFGAASSAYQIEGAWNLSGKGENIWDYYVHNNPQLVDDGSTGDVTCDSYHQYKKDVQLLKGLGVDFYRFSISWSRILPTGFDNYINQEGIDYYNNLIDELKLNYIEPMVTLFHWDLPQPLQEIGGFCNPLMINYFVDYAKVVFDAFADRVTYWLTFNEAFSYCLFGHGKNSLAPGVNMEGVADYLCMHTILLAHSQTYHLFDRNYRSVNNGIIGISMLFIWAEPRSNSTEHQSMADKANQFTFGWNANPIFSKDGNYPTIMREIIDKLSYSQGHTRSRLPEFTQEEVLYMKNSSDFLGVNYYTSFMYYYHSGEEGCLDADVPFIPMMGDLGMQYIQPNDWPKGSPWMRTFPTGLRHALRWVKTQYDNPMIFITENGVMTEDAVEDYDRLDFINDHIGAVSDAINEDLCNVKGYTAWSLMDGFEWTSGFTIRFGLCQIDFKDPNKTRTPKRSYYGYKKIIESRQASVN